MKVYYRVWLNNNANKYDIEGSEYLDIDSHRYKHKKIKQRFILTSIVSF